MTDAVKLADRIAGRHVLTWLLFAKQCTRISCHASEWARDSLHLYDRDRPANLPEVQRFTSSIRKILDDMEAHAAR